MASVGVGLVFHSSQSIEIKVYIHKRTRLFIIKSFYKYHETFSFILVNNYETLNNSQAYSDPALLFISICRIIYVIKFILNSII